MSTLAVRVLPEKRMELSQTIALLIVSIRAEKGCNRCDFCQSNEDENRLFLLEEWDTQENFKEHLKSRRFKVLRAQVGEDTTEIIIGTGIGGTMNGFLTNDFSRTGRAGKMIDVGKGEEPGEFRAINLDHNSSDRN